LYGDTFESMVTECSEGMEFAGLYIPNPPEGEGWQVSVVDVKTKSGRPCIVWRRPKPDADSNGIVFLLAPDPDEKAPLLKAHNEEAEREGAEFGNYGAYTGEGVITSKTTRGILTSVEKNGKVTHHWEEY
jgi:hypothetical protein